MGIGEGGAWTDPGGRGRESAAAAAVARVLALALAVAGCATAPGRPAGAPRLPPVPQVDGPLALVLAYPPEGAVLTASDSNFVFGSTETGRATLRVNGVPVPVAPNGAFLAFLPVPPDGVYRLEASAGGATATLERRVGLPSAPGPVDAGRPVIVPGSAYPAGSWAALPDEPIEVGFLGSPGGSAALRLPDGTRIPLVEEPPPVNDDAARIFGEGPRPAAAAPGPSLYRGVLLARPLAAPEPAGPPPAIGWLPPRPGAGGEGGAAEDPGGASTGGAPGDGGGAGAAGAAHFELVLGGDTARVPLALDLAIVDPRALPVAVLYDPEIDQSADRAITAATGPGFTYHYFWPNGTEAVVDGQRGDVVRVRLTPERSAWVAARQVRPRPAGTAPPWGPVGTVRVTPYSTAIDVRIETPGRLPFQVLQDGATLSVIVFGGTGNTAWLQYGPGDPLIASLEWRQEADHAYRLDVRLTRPIWGYRTFFAENGDLVLRIRRPPAIDPAAPLRGLLVAVDAGHPPGGAIGPTGLTEPEANLAIARRLQRLLEEAGARVLMTRADDAPVALQLRPQMATDADAHLLVSVHNNAFPDGVNPFVNNGTSTYYFQPHSLDLARALHAELLAELGLRDLGVGRSSLAVARATWMPSALTETMYLMIPEQENALRDPAVQERIARAHLRGIEAFLRARAGATR